ncbi:erythromycin esterase family protein [Actinosynnema pretiosum]|uniref:Erythromycin esterase n=1 Tax=Actinosynnema pretiosum TaxID=42197 RepID=A0A290Z7C0_9PSEU|nr:erythromycin esterase family protein [Actinosynnema pretiosum]ATE54896.1 erythromycin esterase [Actinosynnema pretiosum]
MLPEDLDVTALLGAPRLLALGEAMHFEPALPAVRNELFGRLIADHGYRTVSVESCCLRGRLVDEHVRTGAGEEAEVLRDGFSHGFGEAAGSAELLRLLAAHNRAHPHDPVGFAGFDAPTEMAAADSPRAALELAWQGPLPAHVDELLGPDEPWVEPAAARAPARSIGSDPRVAALRVVVEELRWDAAARAADRTPEQRWDVELGLRVASGLLAYHAAMAEDRPDRFPRLGGIRDSVMAENLRALTERGPTLVFAHNQHLRASAIDWEVGGAVSRWPSAGSLLAARPERRHAVIATAVGVAEHQGLGEPEADTVEGRLAARYDRPALVGVEEIVELSAGARKRGGSERQLSYFPLDPAAPRDYDAVLFLPEIGQG